MLGESAPNDVVEALESPLRVRARMPPHRIDILLSLSGVSFEEAWSQRVTAMFGEQDVFVISRPHLIRAKRASGRHIDLHDAENLELGSE